LPAPQERERERERKWQSLINKRLLSFWDISQNQFNIPFAFELSMETKVDIFLDSGAFSAFTQGVEIDINEYIEFIKAHKDHLEVYANLDVIGSPEGTWRNQRRMEKAGVNPLPCFHYGEDPKWLQMYLSRGYDYIALGGMVPISTPDLRIWLDDIWKNYLTDKDGMPIIKVHGFGLTSNSLMRRYPWWSVDSTSWVMTGRMGGVYVPKFKDGKYDYSEDCWKVQVSNRSPSKNEAGKHLESFSPIARQNIEKYFTAKGFKVGVSKFRTVDAKYELKEDEKWNGKEAGGKREVEKIIEGGLSNDYKQRDELNIIYFLDLEKNWRAWPWPFQPKVSRSFSL